MENRSNEATALHPEGDRLLNASLVKIDLNNFIAELKQETTWTESDRNSITVFKSDNMTIVLIGMHANAEVKSHVAKGHINVQVLEGEIEFTAEQKTVSMEKGQMVPYRKIFHTAYWQSKKVFFC